MGDYIWQPPEDEGFEPYKALYIHVPFCKQRCLYCDFQTSAVPCDSPAIDEYLEDMIVQIRRASKADLLGQFETVYIGGGTPSHIGNKRLSALIYTLSLSMHLTTDVECSMEANPESLTESMVKDLFALGVTRLSMGVQSFDDTLLTRLGRIHTADEAREAIRRAQVRFDNISIDLMCGLPGQTLESFIADVDEAVRLGVKHISIYQLTIEDGTPFAAMVERGEIEEDNQDAASEMMEAARDYLVGRGFVHYEVASYALPGYECKHNQAYWTGKPYMGLGPGAVGMMQNDEKRLRYKDGQIVDELTRTAREAEDLMLGMRMAEGVSRDRVLQAQAFLPEAEAVFNGLVSDGYACLEEGRYRPTEKGWLFGNQMYTRILELGGETF